MPGQTPPWGWPVIKEMKDDMKTMRADLKTHQDKDDSHFEDLRKMTTQQNVVLARIEAGLEVKRRVDTDLAANEQYKRRFVAKIVATIFLTLTTAMIAHYLGVPLPGG